jgi:O-antigen ligase
MTVEDRPAGELDRPRIRYAGITLALISPLFYANDGDPYRAYEIVVVGTLLLLIAVICTDSLTIRRAPGNVWIALIVLYIVVQPLLGAGEVAYNLKYALTMLMAFAPLFALQALGPYGPQGRRHCDRMLRMIFWLIAITVLVSYATGAGEVYEGANLLQRRAFGWLGDSIGPAVVFFAFYFLFAGRRAALAVALLCLLLMQAKMSILMVLLGMLVLFLLRHRRNKLLVTSGVTFALLVAYSAPFWFGQLAAAAINNLDYTVNNRLFAFAAGALYFSDSPIIGVGANRTYSLLLNDFDLRSLAMFSEDSSFYEFVQIPNAFIRTAAELGIVGLLLFIGLCVAILRQALRVLLLETALPYRAVAPLAAAAALWLVTFILFHQTTGWFEAGHPQLAWLVSIWALLTCVRHELDVRTVLG